MLVHFSHLLWTGWGGDLNDLIFFYENVQKLRIHFILQELFIFAPTLCVILKAAGSNDIWMELSCGPFHVFHNLKGFTECLKWKIGLCVDHLGFNCGNPTSHFEMKLHVGQGVKKLIYVWILCIKLNRSDLHLVLFYHFVKMNLDLEYFK